MAIKDSIELIVVSDKKSTKQAGAGSKIRVVQWVFDKGSSVKLEKRAYYTENGQVKTGKAEGFGLSDLEALKPKWKEIIQMMKNPPKPPAPKAPARDENEIEEVPF